MLSTHSAHLIMLSAHLIMPSAHLITCSAHLIIRQRCSMSRGCASKGKLTSWGLHRRSATADARGLHTQPQKVQVGWSDFTQCTESTGGICQTSQNTQKVSVGFGQHTENTSWVCLTLYDVQKVQVEV